MAKVKSEYYPPQFLKKEFNCVHCNVFSDQTWLPSYIPSDTEGDLERIPIYVCVCRHCGKQSYWYEDKPFLGIDALKARMVVPSETPTEPSHPDLPEDCRADYEEARNIFSHSPRGAAALLRLCVQKLCIHLGERGKKLDDDIKSLVSKGLPALVQKALDYCRVIGNNAVHPGKIDVKDTPEIAQELFRMINFIVEDRITRPGEIQEAYERLPKEAKERIEKRDKKAR